MGDGLDHALNGLVSSESAQGTSGVNQSNQAAAASEETQVPAAVVLLSDGANSSGTVLPADAAQRARRLGVPVYTIALGTADGVVTAPATPNGQPQMIRVPPDSQTLQEIAEISSARFFSAPTEDDLQTVYRDLGSRIGFVEERQEITFLFATAALILMAGGGGLAALWFNRFP